MFRRSPLPTKLTVRARSRTKTNGFHASHSGLINETTKNGDLRATARGVRGHIGRDSAHSLPGP
jgi:hypothetical protein